MRQVINGITYLGDDVRIATAVGPQQTTRNLIEGNYSYKQRFSQHVAYVNFLPLNTVGISGLLLVEETELEPTGVGEIVEWYRIYTSIPPNRTEQGTAVKTYIAGGYTFSGTILIAAQLISYSATIKADIIYNYFLSATAQTVPALPQALVFTLGTTVYTQVLGGFPTTVINSNTVPSNNYAYCFIGGEIKRWKGDIYERRLVYG